MNKYQFPRDPKKKHFKVSSYGRPNMSPTKCSICHKKFYAQQLKTIGLSGGITVYVCKIKCLTKNIRAELMEYFGYTPNKMFDN